MADPTPEELAAAANVALLTALQAGQSVTFNGRAWTSHDLEKLMGVRATLAGAAGASKSRFAAFSKGA